MRVEELVEMFRDFYGTPSQAKAYIGFDADKANEMLARLNIAPSSSPRIQSGSQSASGR